MFPAVLEVGPWALIEALLYLIALIVFGKVTVVLLGVMQDVGNALYEAVTGPIRVFREYEGHGGQDDEQEDGENNPHRHEVADGGAHEPPPNVLWPPDDAFEEDNRRGNR